MRLCLLVFSVLLSACCSAQLETRNWFLNSNHLSVTPAGVTTGLPMPPQPFGPAYKSTSISDPAGNLIFAFNGAKIIDRNMSVMPALASVNLLGGLGKMQIQKIPNSNKYYVFYMIRNSSVQNSAWTLKYAVVDLLLNSGNGDVTVYDQVVETNSSPSFTLVEGEDPSVAWLVTHRCATDSFFAYRITNAGLAATPVVSKAGTCQTTIDYIFYDLKTSYNGKMIAGITYRDYTDFFAMTWGFTEVFNFNAVTGNLTAKVRTRRTSGYFSTYMSLEFSPDNRLLYTSHVLRIDGLQPCGFGNGDIYQYNLCYTDSILFTRYKMRVANEFRFCAPNATWSNIQMGADKRIHMPFSGITVSNIKFPNRIGTKCDYVFNSYQVPVQNFSQVATPDFHHKMMENAVKKPPVGRSSLSF